MDAVTPDFYLKRHRAAERSKRYRRRKKEPRVTQSVTLDALDVVRLAAVLSSGNVTPGEAAFAGHVMLRLARLLPAKIVVPLE